MTPTEGTNKVPTLSGIEESKGTVLVPPSFSEGKADIVAEDIVHAAEAHEYTDEQFRKLLRKIDFVLLPVMWVSIRSSYDAMGRSLTDN